METRANHFVVGLFVLVAVAALAVFAVWLANRTDQSKQSLYDIGFAGSVGGLQTGSQVRYRGIPVGTVSDVRIDPENVEQVLVTIAVRPGTPIKTDTVATVDTNPLTGISTVLLDGGTQASELLAAKPGDKGFPRITSRASPLEAVFKSTPELLAAAVDMVDRISRVLSDENIAALTRSAQSIDELTQDLVKRREALARLVDQAGGTLEGITRAAGSADTLIGELRATNAALKTTLAELGPAASKSVTSFGDASASIERLSARLDRMAQQLSGPLGDFSRRGLGNAGSLVTEMRDLVVTLTRILKEFERDPAGYLFGGQKGFVPR